MPFADGRLLQEPPHLMILEPGVRLRLHSVMTGRYAVPEDHDSTTQRFCVLDGPFAGTCWSADESVASGSDWRSIDPVEPLP
jgi:hypothetical protein